MPEDAEGQVELKLDGPMLKEHGPQLVTTLFGAFTRSIFPEGGVQVDLGAKGQGTEEPAQGEAEAVEGTEEPAQGEAEAGDASEEAPTGEVNVKLNVDVAGIFRDLLANVKPKP